MLSMAANSRPTSCVSTAALRLHSNPQTGRRFQYDYHRQWHPQSNRPSPRYPATAQDCCRVRSIRLRQDCHRERHQRGNDRLFLTGVMILLFLGNVRATIAVMLSIRSRALPLPGPQRNGHSINTMVLGGMALVLSRLIDNSVVVLENIFRHFEMGSDAVKASQRAAKRFNWLYWRLHSAPHCLLSRRAAYRGQQVPLHRACACSGHRALLLLCSSDDRRSTLLLSFYQAHQARTYA